MADWLLNMLPFEGWRNQPPAPPPESDSMATRRQHQPEAGPSRIQQHTMAPPYLDEEGDTEMMMDQDVDEEQQQPVIDLYKWTPTAPLDYSTAPRRNVPKSESNSSYYHMAEPLSRQGSLPWSLDADPPQWIEESDKIAYELFPITTKPPRIHSQSDPAVYKHIHYTPLPDPRVLREEALQGRIESAMDNLARYSRHSAGGRTRTRKDLERTRDRIRHELESDDEEEWDAEPEPNYSNFSDTSSFGSVSSSSLSSSASTSSSSSMLATPSPTPSSSQLDPTADEPPDPPLRMMKVYIGKFDLNGLSESDMGGASGSTSSLSSRRRGPIFHAILLRIPSGPIHLFHPQHGYIDGDKPGVTVRKRTYTNSISHIPGYIPASRYKIGKIPVECEDSVCDAIMYEVAPDGGGGDCKIWTQRVLKDLRRRAEGRWWIKKVKPVKRSQQDVMVLDD